MLFYLGQSHIRYITLCNYMEFLRFFFFQFWKKLSEIFNLFGSLM